MLTRKAVATLTFAAISLAWPGVWATATERSMPLVIVHGSPLQASATPKRPLTEIELPKDVWDSDIRATGDGMLFAQLDDRIVAIGFDSGTIRWESERGDKILTWSSAGSTAQSDEDLIAAARPRSGRLLASTASSGTVALDIHTGRPVWISADLLAGAVGAWAVLYRNSSTSPTSSVVRLTASAGKRIWVSAPMNSGALQADDVPAIIDDMLYASSVNSEGWAGTSAFDWANGRYRWGVAASHIFFHDKQLLFMENTFPSDVSVYAAFKLSALDRESGTIRWTANYAPDPAVNYTPRVADSKPIYAEAAHVDANWVWFKLFGTWYRYALGPLSATARAERLVGFDIIGFGPTGSMLVRSHGEVAYATPVGDTLVLHPLQIAPNIEFSQKLGSSAVVEAKGRLYEVDLAAAQIKHTFALPCTAAKVLQLDRRLAVFCARYGPDRTKVIEYLN